MASHVVHAGCLWICPPTCVEALDANDGIVRVSLIAIGFPPVEVNSLKHNSY
jgi:hypothetical protein